MRGRHSTSQHVLQTHWHTGIVANQPSTITTTDSVTATTGPPVTTSQLQQTNNNKNWSTQVPTLHSPQYSRGRGGNQIICTES